MASIRAHTVMTPGIDFSIIEDIHVRAGGRTTDGVSREIREGVADREKEIVGGRPSIVLVVFGGWHRWTMDR